MSDATIHNILQSYVAVNGRLPLAVKYGDHKKFLRNHVRISAIA